MGVRQILPDGTVAGASSNAPPSATQSTLGANFSLTTTGTFQDTGLAVTLPAAGTYRLTANVRVDLAYTGGSGYAVAKLFNATDGADVANSETMANYLDAAGHYVVQSMSIDAVVTVAASKTIKLYVKREGAGVTFTSSAVVSNSDGRTRLMYVRIS